MGAPQNITSIRDSGVIYSICTFVTRIEQYKVLVKSFVDRGFSYEDCEYLYIDNSSNIQYDAYRGINKLLTVTRGRYIVLCHQDIILIDDGREKLDAVLSELDRIDPSWGVCGNGGPIFPGRLALYQPEPLPPRISALDESFLIVRRDANLAAPEELRGSHLYGAGICTVAGLLGYTVYLVDFKFRHLNPGTVKYKPGFGELPQN